MTAVAVVVIGLIVCAYLVAIDWSLREQDALIATWREEVEDSDR